MNSQAFIKSAHALITQIRDQQVVSQTLGKVDPERRQQLQKEINSLFSGLQNPTLPTAYRLRDAALAAGFQVDSRVLQRLSQHEEL